MTTASLRLWLIGLWLASLVCGQVSDGTGAQELYLARHDDTAAATAAARAALANYSHVSNDIHIQVLWKSLSRPFQPLTTAEADLLWRHRAAFTQDAGALVRLVGAVRANSIIAQNGDRNDRAGDEISETEVLAAWEGCRLSAVDALALLDGYIRHSYHIELAALAAINASADTAHTERIPYDSYVVSSTVERRALHALRAASNEDLTLLLLPLLQLLRYRVPPLELPTPLPSESSALAAAEEAAAAAADAEQAQATRISHAEALKETTDAYAAALHAATVAAAMDVAKALPPLAQLLVDRATANARTGTAGSVSGGSWPLANALYWQLTAEMDGDEVYGYIYLAMRIELLRELEARDPKTHAILTGQARWIDGIFEAYRGIFPPPSTRDFRHPGRPEISMRDSNKHTALFREKLGVQEVAPHHSSDGLPLPTQPAGAWVHRLDAHNASLLMTTTNPAIVRFNVDFDLNSRSSSSANTTPSAVPRMRDGDNKDFGRDFDPQLQEGENNSVAAPTAAPTVLRNMRQRIADVERFGPRVLLKRRFDARQEQACMDFVRLADRIWKDQCGLDLAVTTYSIVPISRTEGLVQMVEGVTTRREKKKDSRGMSSNVCTPDDPLEAEATRNRFIRSFAATAIVTHLLGIDDRSDMNTLFGIDGSVFQIDFSSPFSRDTDVTEAFSWDPKTYLLQMGIVPDPDVGTHTNATQHPNFKVFEHYLGEGFKCLRRHAHTLLSPYAAMRGGNLAAFIPHDVSWQEYDERHGGLYLAEHRRLVVAGERKRRWSDQSVRLDFGLNEEIKEEQEGEDRQEKKRLRRWREEGPWLRLKEIEERLYLYEGFEERAVHAEKLKWERRHARRRQARQRMHQGILQKLREETPSLEIEEVTHVIQVESVCEEDTKDEPGIRREEEKVSKEQEEEEAVRFFVQRVRTAFLPRSKECGDKVRPENDS